MPVSTAIIYRRCTLFTTISQCDDFWIVRQKILFDGVYFEIAKVPSEGDMLVVVDGLTTKD